MSKESNYLGWGREVLVAEREGINSLVARLDASFESAVSQILSSEGRVLISGIGKSGLIGRKIAATMASTGTRSLFVHPAEAYHGDLGMIDPKDIIILISYSGETEEIIRLLPFLKDNGNKIIGLTGGVESSLAKNSEVVLNISVDSETCPLNLAPTTSTTATLALGDALAIVLMKAKGFKKENFARLHPGGSLGRKLLTKVKDAMKKDNLPILKPDDGFKEIVSTMTSGMIGAGLVLDQGQLVGIISDGDLRRLMMSTENFENLKAEDIMTRSPKTVNEQALLIDVELKMRNNRVGVLPAIDSDNNLVGVLQIYDI